MNGGLESTVQLLNSEGMVFFKWPTGAKPYFSSLVNSRSKIRQCVGVLRSEKYVIYQLRIAYNVLIVCYMMLVHKLLRIRDCMLSLLLVLLSQFSSMLASHMTILVVYPRLTGQVSESQHLNLDVTSCWFLHFHSWAKEI